MRIRIELLPGVSEPWVGNETKRVVQDRDMPAGTTVRQALYILAGDKPEFGALLFEGGTGRWTSYGIVAVNGKVVNPESGLDTALSEGDVLRVMASIHGG